MTLSASALASELSSVMTAGNTPDGAAQKMASAIETFVKSGVPMVRIQTQPGGVAAYMTAGPVMGDATGGIDCPNPGAGLDKSKLKSALEKVYLNPKPNKEEKCKEIAEAICEYLKEANLKLKAQTDGPMPAPAPVGPVAGAIVCKGGLDGESGGGLQKSSLQSALKSDWADVSNKSAATRAESLANAIHEFCLGADVKCDGNFTAVAVVAPVGGAGSYMAGTGTGRGEIK